MIEKNQTNFYDKRLKVKQFFKSLWLFLLREERCTRFLHLWKKSTFDMQMGIVYVG